MGRSIIVKFGLMVVLSAVVTCEWVEIPQLKPNELEAMPAAVPVLKKMTKHPMEIISNISFPAEPTRFRAKVVNEATDRPLIVEDHEKNFSYANIVPLLRKIQTSLISGVRQSNSRKIDILRALKNHLMISIEEKMNEIWPVAVMGKRSKRGSKHDDHYYDDHHKIGFPSNEAALLTLAFLTFGAFLTRLVLNIINFIRNNNGNGNGGNKLATTFITGRRKRYALDMDSAIKIIDAIENFRD